MEMNMTEQMLQVKDLTMHYRTSKGEVSAVNNVSFDIKKGQSLGLVGESGCGKTSIAFSLIRLLPDNAEIKGGAILLDGEDITKMDKKELLKVRWKGISMVFQAAMNALNPIFTVGEQIIEAIQVHYSGVNVAEARERVSELFTLVGLDPKLMDRYPHEFSGGMRQRAVIAMALACNPKLIIADEPTTALDVIVQDRILTQLKDIQERLDMSMIYISHDIAVIAEVSDRIGVMYAGRMAELADANAVFTTPIHPYTYAGRFSQHQGHEKRSHDPTRGTTRPAQSAQRLPVPSPLSPCDGAMPAGNTAIHRASARSLRSVLAPHGGRKCLK
jgi:peptide/nickel transport system ATP-binding protein